MLELGATRGKSTATLFLVPAPVVPVPAAIRGVFGDNDQVGDSGFDGAVAPGTRIALAGRIRLNGHDDFV